MRIVVAPDKFAGTLSAIEAAEAIAEGWRRTAPDDELVLVPLSDGGPGFLDVMHAGLGGTLRTIDVTYGCERLRRAAFGRRPRPTDGVHRSSPGSGPAPDRRGGS
jgi:glycerate kinase